MKALWVAIGLFVVNLLPCYAGDNQAYIDQAGGFSTLYILQDGVGNSLAGLGGPAMTSNPAVIHGDGNNINVQQVGSNDQLQIGIKSTSMPKPSVLPNCFLCPVTVQGNSWSYVVNGNNAVGIIDANSTGKEKSVSNGADIMQSGDNARVELYVKGSYNTSTVNTSGNYETVIINQSNTNNSQSTTAYGGNNNTARVSQSGTNGVVLNNVNGTANTVTVAQQDGGANGHNSLIDLSGNANTVTVTQSGLAGDSTVNLQIRGSTNTFNVTSATR